MKQIDTKQEGKTERERESVRVAEAKRKKDGRKDWRRRGKGEKSLRKQVRM